MAQSTSRLLAKGATLVSSCARAARRSSSTHSSTRSSSRPLVSWTSAPSALFRRSASSLLTRLSSSPHPISTFLLSSTPQIREHGGSNHLLMPTSLIQRWVGDARDASPLLDSFSGGVVRVTYCTSDYLNRLYPAEATHEIPERVRKMLLDAGHLGMEVPTRNGFTRGLASRSTPRSLLSLPAVAAPCLPHTVSALKSTCSSPRAASSTQPFATCSAPKSAASCRDGLQARASLSARTLFLLWSFAACLPMCAPPTRVSILRTTW